MPDITDQINKALSGVNSANNELTPVVKLLNKTRKAELNAIKKALDKMRSRITNFWLNLPKELKDKKITK